MLPELPREAPQPENIPLDILYEDDVLAVINKPPGMVVHPAKGHWSGTLTSALQFHFDQLSAAGGATRPGIVHRLDRDTSGVMVVAKTDPTHMRAGRAVREPRRSRRNTSRSSSACPIATATSIEQPIGIASVPAREDGDPPRSLRPAAGARRSTKWSSGSTASRR